MALKKLSNLIKLSLNCTRKIHSTAVLNNFHEESKKGKYEKEIDFHPIKSFQEGFKMLPGEIKRLKQEVKGNVVGDDCFGVMHKDYEVIWKFDKPEVVDNWIVTNDSDHDEGKSKSTFHLNQRNHGAFSGVLNTEVPKDGITKTAGYCNISSPMNTKSFQRSIPYEWSRYNHILMNVRGDGRTYNVILNMMRDWDLTWNDQYNYLLYTRGGPYWQLAKIPFSKFFMSAKGRVQDKQESIQLDKILNFGITLGDDNDGPFSLEIDFIALIYDQSHTNTFEYEMFEVSPSVHS